jgi:hypothetical protein
VSDRGLDPADANVETGDHHVPTISDSGGKCIYWHRELMENMQARMKQEIGRLGGHYAHVVDESIDSRHDYAAGQAWLHGIFTYALYRRPLANAGHGT